MTQTAPFADRIARLSVPEPNSGCWLWIGCLNSTDYGVMGAGPGTKNTVLAHRAAYETFREPIPEGLVLDHLCRVRPCVNPWHLEPVTEKENILRGIGVGAINARRTSCLLGHPYDSVDSYGRRRCRQCVLSRMRAAYRTRRAGFVKKRTLADRMIQTAEQGTAILIKSAGGYHQILRARGYILNVSTKGAPAGFKYALAKRIA